MYLFYTICTGFSVFCMTKKKAMWKHGFLYWRIIPIQACIYALYAYVQFCNSWWLSAWCWRLHDVCINRITMYNSRNWSHLVLAVLHNHSVLVGSVYSKLRTYVCTCTLYRSWQMHHAALQTCSYVYMKYF